MASQNSDTFEALSALIQRAEADPSEWDRLAERIRQRAADGTIREALGYLPEDCNREEPLDAA
jgi:hypothetical protein